MMQPSVVLMTALIVASAGSAATYKVTKTSNSGVGTLRWAIRQANSRAGPDRIVFDASLKDKVVFPTAQLPAVRDDRTTIDGDIDNDGKPDIALNGTNIPDGSGLVVKGNECVIVGLAIFKFSRHQLLLEGTTASKVRSCHVGVNLAGSKAFPNVYHVALLLRRARGCRIGGATAAGRNVIIAGYEKEPMPGVAGLVVHNSANNTIAGNHIGVNRAGTKVFPNAYVGVELRQFTSPAAAPADDPKAIQTTNNVIGGASPADRNVFAGMYRGIVLAHVSENTIAGNTFGLAADGDTPLPMGYWCWCIVVGGGSTRNVIGGTETGARNVFAGANTGVAITNPDTDDNEVRGNYFGTNAAGDKQRRLTVGVYVGAGAGAQVIGGGTIEAGNYFALKSNNKMYGVWLDKAGGGTLIRHNKFGIRPNGTGGPNYDTAAYISDVPTQVLDNTIANASIGVMLLYEARPVYRNVFQRCGTAVDIGNQSRCWLGDLGNAKTNDDGGNIFRSNNTWHIRNEGAFPIKAEGNRFGTTSKAAINAKIWDKRDNPALGRVDFNPLMGGVAPTGGALTVTGAAALTTKAGGAEIVFNLSAPADVTVSVLNIAGRKVATVLRDAELEAGTQRVVWSGRSDRGTPAPNGMYLVRIEAGDTQGRQARTIAPLRVER